MEDEARKDAIAALAPMDRLTFLIGSVSRADVWLEFQLRQLWMSRVGASYAIYLVPNTFELLVQQCVVLFKENTDCDERVRRAADDALQAARAAHVERNRVIHDMWLPNIEQGQVSDPETFVRQQALKHQPSGKAVLKTLQDVEDTLVALQRAGHRISCLIFLNGMFSDGGIDAPERDESMLRIAEDRFDLFPDGGARPHQD